MVSNGREKVSIQDPWHVPVPPRSQASESTHPNGQPSRRTSTRTSRHATAKSTAATTSAELEKPGIIPNPSSMDPNTDYWRIYQDHLNDKKVVGDADRLRLCQWLSSKDMTKDVAAKLHLLMMELKKRSVPFNTDYYNDLIYCHIKRKKYQDAQDIMDLLAKEPRRMGVLQRTLALRVAMYMKSENEAALQELVGLQDNGLAHYMDQFLKWTKGLQLSSEQINRVKAIFYNTQNNTCPPNSRRFTHLLESRFKMKRPEEALALLNHTLDIGFPAEEFTISCVVSGLVEAGLCKEATQIYLRTTYQSGIDPSLVLLNSLLSALCKEPRQFLAAMDLWNQMLQDPKIRPDSYSFGSMMNGYFGAHNPDSAMDLWTVMQAKPHSIKPTPVLYNTVLSGLFYNHQPDRAKVVYGEMTASREIEVPLDTYNIMIKGLLSLRDLEALSKIMERMAQSGIQPNETTYNIITDTIFSQRDPEAALKVTEVMSSRGVPMTGVTYSAMIAGFVRTGAFEQAQKTYEEMQQAGHRPSIHTYGAMMQGAFMTGNVRLAEEMAHLANTETKEGMSPGAYSIMISGYSNLLMMDQAEKWLSDMQRTFAGTKGGQIPWKVYYTLLKNCLENQQWTSAERVLDSMKASGFHSTVPRLNNLIQRVERGIASCPESDHLQASNSRSQ
ncbi:hypothetical protein BGZ54_009324 [Gamsiella multidivaricata]|nr:hypothetical protein BGZ54_009324 [Gamsiella multidivaricata]